MPSKPFTTWSSYFRYSLRCSSFKHVRARASPPLAMLKISRIVMCSNSPGNSLLIEALLNREASFRLLRRARGDVALAIGLVAADHVPDQVKKAAQILVIRKAYLSIGAGPH